jgi:16S rRNA pseudouridine516 synthase
MMNKPSGVVTATRDAVHRTVLDLLDERDRTPNLFPAGRLDIDTEGFVLITDDGKLAHALLSPQRHVPKTYRVLVEGRVTEEDAAAFAKGVTLEDGYTTLPSRLRILSSADVSEVELVLTEGKYLKRTAIGDVQLDPSLAPGAYRELTEEEVALLRANAGHSGMGPV